MLNTWLSYDPSLFFLKNIQQKNVWVLRLDFYIIYLLSWKYENETKQTASYLTAAETMKKW